eukprot:10867914-Prorocentrum_lima.AAC.1
MKTTAGIPFSPSSSASPATGGPAVSASCKAVGSPGVGGPAVSASCKAVGSPGAGGSGGGGGGENGMSCICGPG